MTCDKCGSTVPDPPRRREGPWKPLLTIGPWRCPHYKVIHQKDPNRCDDPWRMWEGHMPDGRIRSCGIAADKRYATMAEPVWEAMTTYRKLLDRYWRWTDKQRASQEAARG